MEDVGSPTGELELCMERGVIGVGQQLSHRETGDVGNTQETEKEESEGMEEMWKEEVGRRNGANPVPWLVCCRMVASSSWRWSFLGKNGSSQRLLFIKITTKA